MLVDNNLLVGGGYTVYGGSVATKPYSSGANNIRFTNNVFSKQYWPWGGYWGQRMASTPPSPATSGAAMSGPTPAKLWPRADLAPARTITEPPASSLAGDSTEGRSPRRASLAGGSGLCASWRGSLGKPRSPWAHTLCVMETEPPANLARRGRRTLCVMETEPPANLARRGRRTLCVMETEPPANLARRGSAV